MTEPSTTTKIHELSMKDIKPAAEIGARPEFLWMPVDWLFVDSIYQRAMVGTRSRQLVKKIVAEFNWARFQPITVTELPGGFEQGRFAVIDGQHRAAAALLHPYVDEVPVWVVSAPEAREQAKAFVGINNDRNAMTALQIFKAQVAAEDPLALKVTDLCRQAGVTIAFSINNAKKELPPRHTMAVSTIRKLIAKFGEGTVLTALKALADAYFDVPNQLRGQVIHAAVLLFVEHGDRIDVDRLVKALREKNCDDLIDAARQVKRLEGGSTEGGMARAMAAAYDHGLTPARRLRAVVRAAA